MATVRWQEEDDATISHSNIFNAKLFAISQGGRKKILRENLLPPSLQEKKEKMPSNG